MYLLLQLRLHESYSLPILQYATVAVRLNKSQVAELNTCWNAVYRRIFGFMKSEPIRVFIVGLSRLDFVHLRSYLTLKFFRKAQYCHNRFFTQMFTLFKCSKEFKLCIYIPGDKWKGIRVYQGTTRSCHRHRAPCYTTIGCIQYRHTDTADSINQYQVGRSCISDFQTYGLEQLASQC